VRTGFYLGKTMSKTTKLDVKVDVASCLWALVVLVLIIVTNKGAGWQHLAFR
jgi:hypothetical protein